MKNLAKAQTELEKVTRTGARLLRSGLSSGPSPLSHGDAEQSRVYMASFEEKKSALMEQSVVGSGFIFGGQ